MSQSPFSECNFSDAPTKCTYLPLDNIVIKIEPELELDEVQQLENEKNLEENKEESAPNDSCPKFGPVYCQICQKGPFADIPSLQTHTISVHSTNSSFYRRQESIEEQKYSTIDENIAATSFNSADAEQSEKICVYSQSQFTCQQCQATFQTLALFINHMRIQHLANSTTVDASFKSFQCSVCRKGFACSEKKIEHMVQHFISTTSTYSCHCASSFSTAHQLQQHFIMSHTEMLYRCGLCLKLFTENIAYQRHTAQHICETIYYNCVICEMNFKSIDLLIAHVQETHDKPDGVQSYGLNKYQQTTTDDSTVSKAFMTSNSVNSPEEYDVSYKFPSKRHKFLHKTQRLYIKNSYQRNTAERRNGFKCQICDIIFLSQQLLHNHHSKVHESSLLKPKSSSSEKIDFLFT